MAGTLRDITEQHLADEARAASERRYRELFDSAPDGIAIMSANGIVLDANPACCSETGCSRAEIVGRDFADFLAPESNRPKSLQLEFLEHQRSIVTNRNIQRSDGTRIPVELKKWPLPDGTIQMNLRDTSEREQVEELFTKVFDVGPGAMAITRMADATYLAVNNAWQTLTGWTAEEAIGRTSADLGIWLDFSDRARLVARLDRDTTLRGFETRIRHKSGEIREVIVGADTLEMAGFRYMLNSGFDITARKHAEAEIHKINATLDARVRDRTAELQEANRDLESFSYSISHDLQAHVRRIIGFSQTLEQNFSPDLPDGVNRLISKIDSNARRMGQFVTDLLAFSRVGKQHLAHFRVVDMQAEVEHLIEDLGVEDKVLLSNRLPGVSGDPSMLRQVWQNLILNAVKFTRSADKSRIQISGQLLADGRAQYCVEDNGVGFDMAYADKLFGVFQRLHSEREFEGTGVGLAIVQRIITRHGGEVSAQGAVGKGAKFTFTLPENPKFAARSARDRAAPPTPEAP
jgi:PAS domain S-box-containing protein